MFNTMNRALLTVAFGAMVAGQAFGQASVGGGAGQAQQFAAPSNLVVEYVRKGGIANIERDLSIYEDGSARFSEKRTRTSLYFGHLEAEEIAGLEAKIGALTPAQLIQAGSSSADAFQRTLTIHVLGGLHTVNANMGDTDVAALIDWLESLATFVKAGMLDDANKLFEAKLARPDLGGLAACGTTVTSAQKVEVRWEIDPSGRRTVKSVMPLDATDLGALLEMFRAVKQDEPNLGGANGQLADEYVLRFWDPKDATHRIDVHPFVETVPGLEEAGAAILAYLMVG